METLGIFTAFGLSASAGLNAYIPLLVIALLAKYTDLITLTKPWDVLTSWWIIGLLLVLSMIEFFADKVPAVNHLNDLIQTIVRPVAGAIVFAASAQLLTEVSPILSMAAGILVAGWRPRGQIAGSPAGGHRHNRRGSQRARIDCRRCGLHGIVDFVHHCSDRDRLCIGDDHGFYHLAALPPRAGR